MDDTRPDVGRVGLWTDQLDLLPAAQALETAAEIEQLGYGALWLGEVSGREAMTQAALLLGATGRITVATAMASVYGREPVTMAMAQRTLCEMFGDRFLLGLGISHPWFVEQVRGLRFGPRVPTMRAYLDAMDATGFGPPGPPGPPGATGPAGAGHRVLGAVGSGMLALAAERASGALPFGMSVEHTARTRELMGPRPFLGVVQAVLPGPATAAALDLARNYVAESLPNRAALLRGLGHDVDPAGPGADRLVRALVAQGGPDAIARQVREHLAAGADHVALAVIGAPSDRPPLRVWRELAGLAADLGPVPDSPDSVPDAVSGPVRPRAPR